MHGDLAARLNVDGAKAAAVELVHSTATSPHPASQVRPIASLAVDPDRSIEPVAAEVGHPPLSESISEGCGPRPAAVSGPGVAEILLGACCAVHRLTQGNAVGIADPAGLPLGTGVAPVAVVATDFPSGAADVAVLEHKVMERNLARATQESVSPRGVPLTTAPATSGCRMRWP